MKKAKEYEKQFHSENEISLYEFKKRHKYDRVVRLGGPLIKDKFFEDLYEWLNEMYPPELRLPWEKTLHNVLLGATQNAQMIYPDWSRPNYRYIEYYEKEGIFIPSIIPSIKETKPPNGFVVVDVSGSIPNELYDKFVRVILNLMKKAQPREVRIVFFSDKLIKVETLTPNHIPPLVRVSVKRTAICDTIDYVNKNMNDDDFVVVLSDFDIFDDRECISTIASVGAKASAAIRLVPLNGKFSNNWRNWKQIIVNELIENTT